MRRWFDSGPRVSTEWLDKNLKKPNLPTWQQAGRGLGGGLLLGWGAMTGLGCTVGNLLSGTMAGALSGWAFGAAVLASVWAGLRLRWSSLA